MTAFSALQPPLVQAIFNRNAEEVQLLLHKKEDVNALVRVTDVKLTGLYVGGFDVRGIRAKRGHGRLFCV